MESFEYEILLQIIKWLQEKDKLYSKIEKEVNGIAFDYSKNNNSIECNIDHWQWLNSEGYKHHPDNEPSFYKYFEEIVRYHIKKLNVSKSLNIYFYKKHLIQKVITIDDKLK